MADSEFGAWHCVGCFCRIIFLSGDESTRLPADRLSEMPVQNSQLVCSSKTVAASAPHAGQRCSLNDHEEHDIAYHYVEQAQVVVLARFLSG